jgi:hypothetical protein
LTCMYSTIAHMSASFHARVYFHYLHFPGPESTQDEKSCCCHLLSVSQVRLSEDGCCMFICCLSLSSE